LLCAYGPLTLFILILLTTLICNCLSAAFIRAGIVRALASFLFLASSTAWLAVSAPSPALAQQQPVAREQSNPFSFTPRRPARSRAAFTPEPAAAAQSSSRPVSQGRAASRRSSSAQAAARQNPPSVSASAPVPLFESGEDLSAGIRGTSSQNAVQTADRPASRLFQSGTAKRSRPPTQEPVRAVTQVPTLNPAVAPDVQPQRNGLPDIAPIVVPAARRRPPDNDPFAPIGYRFETVTLFPSTEESIGYDDNPNRSASAKKGSMLYKTEGAIGLQSNWSRHDLNGTVRGAYNWFPDLDNADRPEADGRLNLRLDVTRDAQIDAEARFRLDTQRPSSPELNAVVRERPAIWNTGAGLGFTQRFNRLALTSRGFVDRFAYEDALLSNGLTLDQGDRNFTQYGAALRAGYEVKPGFVPFIEAQADTRLYDRRRDNAGFERDSMGLTGRLGSSFEITRLLAGEGSIGYQHRDYEDGRLKELRGLIADASLVWSASALTTIRGRMRSELDETSLAGASGIVVRRANLEVQHDLRRYLSVTGLLGVSQSDYKGPSIKEDGVNAGVRLDYKMSRSVVVRASFNHERLRSSQPNADYTANIFLVGLRLQR
jgi:hypothetical protein